MDITTNYEAETNTAYVYDGQFLIASLCFNNDTFEEHGEFDKTEGEHYYNLMVDERQNYLTFLDKE